MTDHRDLCVEVRYQDIVVTMPGTTLKARGRHNAHAIA